MKKLLIIVLMPLISGCNLVLSKMYGVRNLKEFDIEKCEKFVSGIENKDLILNIIYADTNAYDCILNLSGNEKIKKDLSQPVQILYFLNDSLASFHANCYAQGSISSLDWNTEDRFSEFTPISAIDLTDYKFSIEDFAGCYNGYSFEKNKKYVILIYWTLMIEKISKSAIETVINNVKENHADNDVLIYLINNDQSFIE